MSAGAGLGPCARHALAAPITGSKRRRVLLAVALYLDCGRSDPSIRELAERAKLPRGAVVSIISLLDCDGLLEVRRGDCAAGERNVYRFPTTGGAS